jgi:cell fate regulator YaaT (PSP1 superfamily)
MEEKLSCASALTDDFDALSKRIKEQANLMINSEFESHVAAAGFMVALLDTY